MGIFDTLFGGGQSRAYRDMVNAYNQAMAANQGAFNRSTGYMQPFLNAGQSGLTNYQNALSAMANPQQYYQQLMSGYSISPQAQFQQQQAMTAANQAAAASGMLGSGQEQKAMADYTQQLVNRDQQQWLENMLGINNKYLSGEADLGQLGFAAGRQMGDWSMQSGEDLSKLLEGRGQAQAGMDLSNSSILQNILGMGGNFLRGGLGSNGLGKIPTEGFWGGGLHALFPFK
jgi:hypothetical protein